MAHIQQLPNDCNGDGGAAAEDSAVDENNRTVCWLKYVTALTDLSHVPAFASQDKLPEAAVSALDAVMEDYRCNGPTVASQQVQPALQQPTSCLSRCCHQAEKRLPAPERHAYCYCSCP